jgi:hypothetical protein
VSSAYSPGIPNTEGAVAADGTLTVRRAVQVVGTRTVTVRAGGETRTAQLNVVPGNFSVAITSFSNRSLGVHTDPGMLCVPRITLSDGSVLTRAGDLLPQATNADGDTTWYFAALTAPLGPATANVSCAWSDLVIADERALVIGFGLYGHVADRNGVPVPEAAIQLFQGLKPLTTIPQATADAFGNYAFVLSPGIYRVQAVPSVASGLSSGFATDALTVSRGTEFTLIGGSLAADITLPEGRLVTGKVVDQKTLALPGRNVFIVTGGVQVISVVTDSAGEFAVRLPDGSYALYVYPPGACCSGSALLVMSITVSADTRLPLMQLPP